MPHSLESLFPALFPVYFAGIWLAATTILGVVSGWFELAQRYPDRKEPPLLKIGSQSGMMRLGVGINGILVLSACPSGLRVAIWRVFGPFSKPFFVPWNEISVRPSKVLFRPMARLSFGNPEAGVLTLEAQTWERLVQSASQHAGSPVAQTLPSMSEGRLLQAYVLEWATLTTLAAAFFFIAPRLLGARGGALPPLVLCVAFPAAFVGVVQAGRYLTQRSWRRRSPGT